MAASWSTQSAAGQAMKVGSGSDAVLRSSPPSPVSGLNRTFGSVATGPPRCGGDCRMAIYHLAAQEFSRGAGDSAVHAAAYRARCALVDERTGLKHDYSRKA